MIGDGQSQEGVGQEQRIGTQSQCILNASSVICVRALGPQRRVCYVLRM